jgi:hypothetical protein
MSAAAVGGARPAYNSVPDGQAPPYAEHQTPIRSATPGLTSSDRSMIERSDQLLRTSRDVIARTARTVARSGQLMSTTWDQIHASEKRMAAQAGRLIVAPVSAALSRRQRPGAPALTEHLRNDKWPDTPLECPAVSVNHRGRERDQRCPPLMPGQT